MKRKLFFESIREVFFPSAIFLVCAAIFTVAAKSSIAGQSFETYLPPNGIYCPPYRIFWHVAALSFLLPIVFDLILFKFTYNKNCANTVYSSPVSGSTVFLIKSAASLLMSFVIVCLTFVFSYIVCDVPLQPGSIPLLFLSFLSVTISVHGMFLLSLMITGKRICAIWFFIVIAFFIPFVTQTITLFYKDLILVRCNIHLDFPNIFYDCNAVIALSTAELAVSYISVFRVISILTPILTFAIGIICFLIAFFYSKKRNAEMSEKRFVHPFLLTFCSVLTLLPPLISLINKVYNLISFEWERLYSNETLVKYFLFFVLFIVIYTICKGKLKNIFSFLAPVLISLVLAVVISGSLHLVTDYIRDNDVRVKKMQVYYDLPSEQFIHIYCEPREVLHVFCKEFDALDKDVKYELLNDLIVDYEVYNITLNVMTLTGVREEIIDIDKKNFPQTFDYISKHGRRIA